MSSNNVPALVPLLVVRDAARAIDFYLEALGSAGGDARPCEELTQGGGVAVTK